MANLTLKIEKSKELINFLEKFRSKGLKQILNFSVNKTSSFLASFIISRHLTGGTAKDKLAVRSGRLRQTTVPRTLTIKENSIEGGVQFGTKYADIHISRKPKSTIITPKTAKNLAIPIPGSPAVTASGVTRFTGGIRQAFPFLSFVKSKKGNKLLVDTRNGKFIPYFVLKKQVKIDSRVHTDDILNKNEQKINSVFKKAIDQYINANI